MSLVAVSMMFNVVVVVVLVVRPVVDAVCDVGTNAIVVGVVTATVAISRAATATVLG
jgi:hypothetical protein